MAKSGGAMKRRDFLVGVGSCLGLSRLAAAAASGKELDVLVLGGTDFFGPSIVAELLDRGHRVTLFNRGRTNPHLFPEVEKIRGDRELDDGSGIARLKNRRWDIVIDTWQKAPRCVADTARLLRGHVGQYQYVSSISVYKDWSETGITEDAALNDVPAMPAAYATDLRYSLRKTLAELALMQLLPDEHAIFRSHGMRGVRIPVPGDEPYWPVRIARGGDVLAPGSGDTVIQFTDIVSLCRFMGDSAERGTMGAFNVLSECGANNLRDYLEACRRVTGSDARLIWVPRQFLESQDIRPYRDLPMWRPEPAGFYTFSADKAIRNGLRNRPLEATIEDMLAGYRKRSPGDGFRFGQEPHHGTISMRVEANVLEAWFAHIA
jgi:2'-hydroxyisoflavone reductase